MGHQNMGKFHNSFPKTLQYSHIRKKNQQLGKYRHFYMENYYMALFHSILQKNLAGTYRQLPVSEF